MSEAKTATTSPGDERELSDEQWYDLAEKYASKDWNGDQYFALIQAVGKDAIALSSSTVQQVGAELTGESEIQRLRDLAGTCYAGLGAECDLPEAWLDALSNAADGRPFTTEGLLPFTLSGRAPAAPVGANPLGPQPWDDLGKKLFFASMLARKRSIERAHMDWDNWEGDFMSKDEWRKTAELFAVPTPADPQALLGWTRYEKARKLNPAQWAELHQRNLRGENFDDMIDALPATTQPVQQDTACPICHGTGKHWMASARLPGQPEFSETLVDCNHCKTKAAPQDPSVQQAEPTDEQILSCMGNKQPARTSERHGAAIFEYRLFGLIDFARRVLALAAQQSERPAPAGQAVDEDEIHLAWRGALKACGVSEADRDAISQVVRDMLAASQAERPAVKEDKA